LFFTVMMSKDVSLVQHKPLKWTSLVLYAELKQAVLTCSEKYASKWFIGLSFVKQQHGMQIDLTFEIRNFCDLGM